VAEPHNLAPGWVGLDYEAALGCPVKLVNDAEMQALGSYKSGKMLFLGLGTGLGSTLVVDGLMEPMAGASSLQEGDLRELCRPAGIEDAEERHPGHRRGQERLAKMLPAR
jgi:hypothetical protein